MTQEEKAKRYDEALEELRGLLECVHEEKREILKEDIINIFPEFKESSDERIRQELIAIYSVGAKANMKTGDIPDKDIVAWLEKQGEIDKASYEIAEKEKREFVGDGFIKCHANFQDFKEGSTYWLEYIGNDNYNVRSDNLLGKIYHITPCQLYTIFKKQTWFEMQDEQKPQGKTALEAINEEKVDNANKVEPKDYSSIDPHFGKPIDKVEPKFKAGDWIVRELDNSVHQVKAVIENISNGKYGYDLTKGGYISSQDANFYHLWTILDANDGDVIYTPKGLGVEGIFLVSGWQQIEGTGKTLCSYIGYRVEEDEIVVCRPGAIWWDGVVDPFFPATKEQRDTLEKAMADAGYTFDFEKKKLKKIEDETE